MDQGFQTLLLAGKYVVGDGNGNFPSFTASDDTFVRQQMTYLTRNYETSLLSALIYPYTSSFDAFTGNIIPTAKVSDSLLECNNWRCFEKEEKLKRLKTEPSTDCSSSSPSFNFIPTSLFHQLPALKSMEQVDPEVRRLKLKFPPVETAYAVNLNMLEPTLTNFNLTANYISPAPVPIQQLPALRPPRPESKLSAREQAYKRRHTLSDKTRSLQKLLPVDKKMDMATIYEEAYKYIKFLKAQISVLESMPVSSTSASNFRSENPRYGGLGKLNRQQLLEIILNSPAAQSTLYSNGCCVYSLEQLMLFNGIAEKNFFSDH